MNDQVQKIIKHPATAPTGIGILAFGMGMTLGFLLGRKTKKHPTADLHVMPNLDLDLNVEDVPKKRPVPNFVVKTEEEAVLVINTMNDVINEYQSISVSEFNDILGAPSNQEDTQWGWTELDYSMVEKVKEGYMLVLPGAERLEHEVEPEEEEEVEVASDETAAVGREFIKNRFLGLPDLSEIEELVDEAEDEASEAEEDAPTEEAFQDVEATRRANAFASGGDNWDLLKEMRGRTESAPYVLHKDEFYADEKGYGQHSLSYYAGDNIMADEDDKPVYNHDIIVGELKWGHGSGDPLIFYVRNDKYRAEYEITYVDGLFSVEVMGEEIENNQRVRNLEHSDEPRRFRDRTE